MIATRRLHIAPRPANPNTTSEERTPVNTPTTPPWGAGKPPMIPNRPATPEQHRAYRAGRCIDCKATKHSAGRPRCNPCHAAHTDTPKERPGSPTGHTEANKGYSRPNPRQDNRYESRLPA